MTRLAAPSLRAGPPGRRPFALRRWFSVLSLICIGATCITSSWLLSRFLTQHMLQRDAAVMLEFVQSVADIENVKARNAGREPDVRDRGMYELFDHLSGVPYMLRTNIYAPDQTVAWSSEKNLIGKRFNANHELEAALAGRLVIETGETGRSQHPKHEHMFLSDQPVDFVETYLPLHDRETGKVIGVAELYRIPRELFQTIEKGHRLIWTTGLLSALLLYFALFWIVRRGDATIRSQQSRLIESETLAAVGEMGSAVAHGIRNPLASIRSSAELCIDDKVSPMVRESATDIIAQVDRLEKWVRDLLSYAQPEHAPDGRVRLDALVGRVCEHFARDFERQHIRLAATLPSSMPPVVGDEAALEQVFANILSNAMEAMPDGGVVTISSSGSVPGADLVVTVHDTGVGIAEAQKPHLFTPFQTTKAKGMGLGLALVRRILRRFGGDVRIESAAGAGTEVVLTFSTLART